MFHEQNSKNSSEQLSFDDHAVPEEVRKLVADMIHHCPFRVTDSIDWQHLPVTFTKEKDGWFFTCEVCSPSHCSGFIKDKPY